jgi:hypothetical protein
MSRIRDEGLTSWVIERIREREEVTAFEVLCWDPVGGRPPYIGCGRLHLKHVDNLNGSREVSIDVHPILPGRIEVRVRVETQAKGGLRAHSEAVSMTATPEAIRKFAALLVDAAAEVEEIARVNRPQPV